MITVDREKCTACGACVTACPTGAIHLVQGELGSYAEVDQTKCRHCEACLNACPEHAIVSTAEPAIEGELVPVRAKPLPVRQVRSVQAAPQALALLGAAMAFAGREILPRVTTALLDAWDRRAGRPAPAPRNSTWTQPAPGPAASMFGRGGRQRRRRRRRGRR